MNCNFLPVETAAKPSENLFASTYCGSITTVPDLSMYPNFPFTETSPLPSENLARDVRNHSLNSDVATTLPNLLI